eukprot:TRINITY_DN8078_c0_g1_i1.p1 TRINITY_DN8078_c0_g1~~TRINITY_DN8078_c0_g1_i1.p1  ORF type:complete len:294 (-),score=29.56 TRINITY_DN8078_c0_g1_i1:37-918(-)
MRVISALFFVLLALSVVFVDSRPAANGIDTEFVISNLGTSETRCADDDQSFGPVAVENGFFVASIETPYSVDICFQEVYCLLGSISQNTCNPEGYIHADISSASVKNGNVVYNSTLYLRYLSKYQVSASWVDSDHPTNMTGTVYIKLYYVPCPSNSLGYGPNCSIDPFPVSSKGWVASFLPDTIIPFSFTIGDLTLYSLLTLTVVYTPIGETSDSKHSPPPFAPLQVYCRRDAYPVLTNGVTISDPPSFNSSFNNKVISFEYVNPESGSWFVLIKNVDFAPYIANVTVNFKTD